MFIHGATAIALTRTVRLHCSAARGCVSQLIVPFVLTLVCPKETDSCASARRRPSRRHGWPLSGLESGSRSAAPDARAESTAMLQCRGSDGIAALVHVVRVGLVFDELAAGRIYPTNTDHRLALLTQPLLLGALGVALIIFGSSPTKSERSRRRIGGDAQFGRAGRGRKARFPEAAHGHIRAGNCTQVCL
jgi:hypothetical protein